MDYIKEHADRFSTNNFRNGLFPHALVKAKKEIENFEKKDKIKFINILMDWNRRKYNEHLKRCNKGANCVTDRYHEGISFGLKAELDRAGVTTNKDQFSANEKADLEKKIDEILKNQELMKVGQQVIYDDFLREFEELKDLLYLGKKNWKELLMGKITSMAARNIISQTIAKIVVENFIPEFGSILRLN